jgi:lysophospholipase L1-like esterase
MFKVTRRQAAAAVFAFCVGAVCGAAVILGVQRFGGAGDHPHGVVRRKAILSQADQMSPQGVVVLGDSRVELARIDDVCGLSVLNAGIGGQRLAGLSEFAPELLKRARPKIVLISIGVNDAQFGEGRDITSWLARYDALLGGLGHYDVYVVAIDAVEAGKPLGDTYFDQKFIDAENAGLEHLAQQRGMFFIPPQKSAQGMTLDGVHANTAGYRDLNDRIKKAVDCTRA